VVCFRQHPAAGGSRFKFHLRRPIGTPTAAGTFNFTIQVVDAAGRSASGSFSIVVGTALTITTATLPNGTVGTAYSQTLAAAGGNGALTWSIATGALPGGITLNSTTGALSGFPPRRGHSPSRWV